MVAWLFFWRKKGKSKKVSLSIGTYQIWQHLLPRKEGTIYASIRHYKTNPGAVAEIARLVDEGFLPIISNVPGFFAYFALDTGNDTDALISVFQDEARADESDRMAADWAKENIASHFASSAKITDGEVLNHKIT